MGLSGGCLCGAVHYECAVDPVFSGNCHCRNCQKMTGSAYSAVFFVPENTVTITGEVKYFERQSDNGGVSRNGFCPACGSPLFGKPSVLPGLLGIRAGTLDDPNLFKPQVNIYTSRAAHWDAMDPALPQFAEMPPKG